MKDQEFRKILEENDVQILKAASTTNIYFECPFCDKGKRASYNIERDIYTCWSCKADGEKRATGKATNMQSYLSGKAIKRSNNSFKSDEYDFKNEVYDALEKVIDFHQKYLDYDSKEDLAMVMKKIEKNGMLGIRYKYKLGFAPSDQFLTAKTLIEQGVSRRALLNTGLFVVECGQIKEILSGWVTLSVEDSTGKTASQIGINLLNDKETKTKRTKSSILYKDTKENMELRMWKLEDFRKEAWKNRRV